MLDDALRQELLAMRAEDLRVRQELLDSGELGGTYVPRMEAVHVKNATRLKEIITLQGWPTEENVGKDGAEAAWLIVQHGVGDSQLQRRSLALLLSAATSGHVPMWHAAYLEDRIALYERRPQRYGTQWVDDPVDGRTRPWKLIDPDRVNEFRAEVGLPPLHPIPERGPELPADKRQEIEENERWWKEWLASKGWSG
jgi:hypothetical protein